MRATAAFALLAGPALMVASQPAWAELDLARAGVERLENGLTVIVLEERSLPVVSTQVVYKSGSRDETAGKTGLAHFLEHLAFRASENFPDGAASDAIYDAGGEWHGYTWLDQTTYYSTMPAEGVDLLLAIEADRMARVTIDPAAIEAEKGAVFTEMRGYQNDPSSVLFDAVVAAAMQAHPYRNNTIGSESDVAGLTAEDARAFYSRHYAPGNAVLAVVGDVDAQDALARVRAQFGGLEARVIAPRVVAVEPVQTGPRRVELTGPVERHYLRIAYPAPAAASADFAPFLLMQQLLSGGSGVNFRQNDWGTPSVEGAVLAGAAADMSSWFIPTADPYVFMLAASTEGGRTAIEGEIVQRIASFRHMLPSGAQLEQAKAAIRAQLAFDLETTEDAAHQLAFFEGIGALPALLGLDDALDAVTPADVGRVANLYLDPQRRTTGWYGPGEPPALISSAAGTPHPAAERPPQEDAGTTAPPAQVRELAGGLPAIVREVNLSPTASVLIVTRGDGFAPGYGMVTASGLAQALPDFVAEAASAIGGSQVAPGLRSNDPTTRLLQMLAEHREGNGGGGTPVLAVISGAADPQQAFALLETQFGSVRPAAAPLPRAASSDGLATVSETIDLPLAQAAIGYTLAAPPPASREGLAMQMLLYVLTHEYGGRLGEAAISDSGLLYYIGSDYAGDVASGRVEITAGVDPVNIDAMEALMRAEIARLATTPPSVAELAAARAHILGRERSAAMDNGEIAAHLARTWLATGTLPDPEALERQLAAIGPRDIARAARAFANGTILRVDIQAAPEGDTR